MHAIGLHGNSFLPLVMGFGCNVPAIVAVRHLQNKRQRLLTILIIPFMSCNARLPVFVLITGAFFAPNAASVMFLLYLIGIIIAAVSGLLFSVLFFSKKSPLAPEQITLPAYRVPPLRPTLQKVWSEASDYLKKITNVVLVASGIIWALNTFPLHREGDLERLSYLQQAGKAAAPVFAPLGFDWKISVALVTGVVAKETIVSSLAVLYPADSDSALSERLLGEGIFSQAAAAAFLIFVLLYFPCIAVVNSIYRETKSVLFTLFSVSYCTGLAWVCAFLTYKIGGWLM